MNKNLKIINALCKVAKVICIIIEISCIIGVIGCIIAVATIKSLGTAGIQSIISSIEIDQESLNDINTAMANFSYGSVVGAIIKMAGVFYLALIFKKYFKKYQDEKVIFTEENKKYTLKLGIKQIIVTLVTEIIALIVCSIIDLIQNPQLLTQSTENETSSDASISLGLSFVLLSIIIGCAIEEKNKEKPAIEE